MSKQETDRPDPEFLPEMREAHGRAAASIKAEVREAMENAENVSGYFGVIWFIEAKTQKPSMAIVSKSPMEPGFTFVHVLGDLLACLSMLSAREGIPGELVTGRCQASAECLRLEDTVGEGDILG